MFFRSKIQDLNSEIAHMTQEIEAYNEESATYLTFEKRWVCLFLDETIP